MTPSATAPATLSFLTSAISISTTSAMLREFSGLDAVRGRARELEQLLQPTFAYDRFASRTLAMLRDAESESYAAALAGSIFLASEQNIRLNSLMQPFIERAYGESFDLSAFAPKRRPVVNRFRVQRDELLEQDQVPEEADYETLAPLAPSADLFEQARRCFELIGTCEEASQTCNGKSVFKFTPALVLSFANLLGTVACSRATLTLVVENLYIVLYEAAGKDHLRYIENGYVTKDECEVIWRIKHLRNKWLSHDADHGSDSDIKKSWRTRKEALEWFGFNQMPNVKDDYALIHRLLLNKVEEFLKILLERIAAPPGVK